MGFSPEYLALLKEFEGFYANPYVCPAGCCTIGFGTNLEAHRDFIPWADLKNGSLKGKKLCEALKERGMRWDRAKAESAMISELEKTHALLQKRCKAYVVLLSKSENVRAHVVLDMAYNMGISTLLTFHSTLPMIERGDYSAAALNLKTSRWYKQVGRRARADCQMLRTGEYMKPEDVK